MKIYRSHRPNERLPLWITEAACLLLTLTSATPFVARAAAQDAHKKAHDTPAPPKDEDRLVCLVLLLREPRPLDEHSLANTITKAVGISHVHDENAAHFVVAKPPYYLVKLDAGRFVINSISEPYFKNAYKLADETKDRQLARAIREHRAWLSIDWAEQEGDLKKAYQQIGKMAAALAGPDTLAICNPDTDSVLPYDAALAETLKGDDPLQSFVSALTEPATIFIRDDDPRLKAAEDEAKKRWPEFVRAFREKTGQRFAVKGRLVEGENAEYAWLSISDVDDKLVHGTLANATVDLKGFEFGQDLHIKLDDVDDWLYVGPDKQPQGGFTQKVLREAAKAQAPSRP